MIGSQNTQPDIKLYLSEIDFIKLKEGHRLIGQLYDHIRDSVIGVTLGLDSGIRTGVERTRSIDEISVGLSHKVTEELRQQGFIGGLRMNHTPEKITLIILERLADLKIGSDERDNLTWGHEILQNKINQKSSVL